MEYSVETSEFTGPLDLLLHLIEKAKVDIKNIFISEITEQYLDYVANMQKTDMELSSEFVSIAATLLLIKSKSLLPKREKDDDEFDEEYEKQLIIDRLEEYKLIKNSTNDLRNYEREAAKYFTKLPEEIIVNKPLDLDDVDKQTLYKAFLDLMQRKKDKPQALYFNYVKQDRFTIKERIEFITLKLSEKKKMRFDELFDDAVSKIEVVVTFCALLELLSKQVIKISQSDPFNNITITQGT